MAQISWSEVRDLAIRFSREWTGTSSESAEKQTFWNEFFEVFGLRRRSVATFEEPVQRIRGTYGKSTIYEMASRPFVTLRDSQLAKSSPLNCSTFHCYRASDPMAPRVESRARTTLALLIPKLARTGSTPLR
jgi:hypothetical protein